MNEYRDKSKAILEKIIDQATDDTVSGLLDERFNDIISAYRTSPGKFAVTDSTDFHSVITWFLENIYQDRLLNDQILLAEGIFILETFCQGFSQKGYEGLYYDLLNYCYDVEHFFKIFFAGVKSYHLGKNIDTVCLRHIDPCDHQLKYAVVTEIIQKYGHLLDDEICRHPAHYIDKIPGLLEPVIGSIEIFSEMTSRL